MNKAKFRGFRVLKSKGFQAHPRESSDFEPETLKR